LAPKAVDVVEVIHACVATEQHAARVRGHEITVDLPSDLPMVSADRMALRRVLCCLFENAFKYTPDGGRVVVSAEYRADGIIAISVTDNGRGIRAEDLPHVCDKFYRGQIPRSSDNEDRVAAEYAETSGVGLGLYVARSIVQHLGGDIEIRSEVGVGSTFTVQLPAWCDLHPTILLERGVEDVEEIARRG
jgi:signal transduction histidine kinase